ncbi:MAG: 3D domain-containing protein [Phycisphaerae bacterium]|nr:3D domain-containing protein [Phycisphaerae bacterium]
MVWPVVLIGCAGVVLSGKNQEGRACFAGILGSDRHRLSQDEPDVATSAEPAVANASILPEPAHAELSGPRVVMMEVTAYCPCRRCCGPHARGLTASGKPVSYNHGRFVAADTSLLPFGSVVSVPGYYEGQPVEVIDRGGAIKGNRLDVYFPDHETAKHWGRKHLAVLIHHQSQPR